MRASIPSELGCDEVAYRILVLYHFIGDEERPVPRYEQVDALLLEIRMIHILPAVACLFLLVGNSHCIRVLAELQRVDQSWWVELLQLYLLFYGGEEGCEVDDRHSQSHHKENGTQEYGPFDLVHHKADDGREGENGCKDDRTSVQFEALEDVEDEKLPIVLFTEFYCDCHAATIA